MSDKNVPVAARDPVRAGVPVAARDAASARDPGDRAGDVEGRPPAGFDRIERSLDLRRAIEQLPKPTHLAILTQDNPDPDAIGSALGLQRICNHLRPDLSARIYHGGHISHPQNRTMVELLGINLLEVAAFEELEGPRFVMLVDAANTGAKNIQCTDAVPDAVFDHHHDRPPAGTKFVDIRPVGATCTIIAEHLVHLGTPIGPKLATALYFGLHNDTGEFSTGMTDTDWAAMRYLQPKIDGHIFREIRNYPIPTYLFDLERLAIEHKRQKGTLLVCGLGYLEGGRRDGIPHVADRLLRLADVRTVIVHAIVEDRIHASLRTRDDKVDANGLIQSLFGASNAGAKNGSGGAQVRLGWLTPASDLDDGTRTLFARYVNEVVARRAFAAIGGG